MSITIKGLSPRQMLFADILWACKNREQVDAFIASLPKDFQFEARIVLNMMVASIFDDVNDTSMAQNILQKVMK